jgi:dephospho-CoA kinase
MKVVGLTGGIGMGKSTAARAFERARIPVFDADAAVHHLQARGGRAVRVIEREFPGTTRDGAVDRVALRAAVLGKPEALKRLEHILHPMVASERDRFIQRARRGGKPAVVLDVPLLFEVKWDKLCDLSVVVSAPKAVQTHRVRLRRKMSDADIQRVISLQMPDREKRRRADVVIRTGLSRHLTDRAMRRLIADLRP